LTAATLEFRDGSTLSVPRAFSGRVLDLGAKGEIARGVLHTRRSSRSARLPVDHVPAVPRGQECFRIAGGVDTVFYRAQPEAQDRYARLAFDDIRRTPAAYLLATMRRMIGMFVTVGSENADAAHQFAGSRLLYVAGTVVTITVFLLFLGGLAVAWRRGGDIVPLVAAAFYVPVTISPFLTNARYALSGQPFVFAFVAIAIVAAYDVLGPPKREPREGGGGRADQGSGRQSRANRSPSATSA
jgi:hypothetical protein